MQKFFTKHGLAFETVHLRALTQRLALTFVVLTVGYVSVDVIGKAQSEIAEKARAGKNAIKMHAVTFSPDEKIGQ